MRNRADDCVATGDQAAIFRGCASASPQSETGAASTDNFDRNSGLGTDTAAPHPEEMKATIDLAIGESVSI
jgi:hypothetical protein